MPIEFIILGVFGIWLTALSVIFFLMARYLNNLTRGTKGEGLKKILDNIFKVQSSNIESVSKLSKELKRLDEEGSSHIQKVGVVRFNPFKETGGDHSFSVAVMDKENSGFIFTGIHTRERTRLYIKEVKKGKSQIELSEEEKKAFTQSQRNSV